MNEKIKDLKKLIANKKEFERLEGLINQIMLKSKINFSEDDRELLKEVFGGKESSIENNEKVNDLTD